MIIIRADAGPKIGAGHIMRCLSLADALKDINRDVIFVSADENAGKMVEARGYKLIALGTDSLNPLDELDKLKCVPEFDKAEAIVLDSYYIHTDYVKEIKKTKTVVCIDDLLDEAFPADLVINYNLFANEKAYDELYLKLDNKPLFILGPIYAPLRKEFSLTIPYEVKENVESVLVLTGGADPCHVALGLAREICKRRGDKNELDAQFHLVVGALSQDYEEIENMAKVCGDRIILHRNVSNMKELMVSCDLAVSAAGSTLYELCACGVPTITYVTADNQIEAEKCFSEKNIMLSVGDARNNESFFEGMYSLIQNTVADRALRDNLSAKSKDLIDGKGAERLAKEIVKRLR